MTYWGDIDWEDDDTPPEPHPLEVDVNTPVIVAELIHPDGTVLATLLDRPTVPFGYQPNG